LKVLVNVGTNWELVAGYACAADALGREVKGDLQEIDQGCSYFNVLAAVAYEYIKR
jgi:hypothetical protein